MTCVRERRAHLCLAKPTSESIELLVQRVLIVWLRRRELEVGDRVVERGRQEGVAL
jgi:hypothetical protein